MATFTRLYRGGTCVLCGQSSDDVYEVTGENPIKRVLICADCKTKIDAPDHKLFERVMRMLD